MANSRTGAAVPTWIDGRPVLLRSDDNIWTRAEHERDKVYDALAQAVQKEGVEPLLLKSTPYVFPPWVKIEIWVPQENRTSTDRSWATLSIEPKPGHKFEFEFNLTYSRDDKKTHLPRILPFGEDSGAKALSLVRYLLRRGDKPYFSEFRTPGSSLDIFKPENVVSVVRPDRVAQVGVWLLLIGIVATAALAQADVDLWLKQVWVLSVLGVIIMWHAAHRPRLVKNEGKPYGEPRSLSRVDSWQTMIFGAGDQAALFHKRLLEQLGSPPTDKFNWHQERVWYWGLEGKEEREQLVFGSGRGIVFCQIYQYGQDLYIGWDGHLNYGQWVESPVATGIDIHSKKLTAIQIVRPGTQVISEYDVIDLSCLMEWAHAQMVKLAKQLLTELKIDQEIDFKILRGERQGLTSQGTEAAKERDKLRVKRTG